jgi:AraC family transcriptional regulator, transcriptional activator of pobA
LEKKQVPTLNPAQLGKQLFVNPESVLVQARSGNLFHINRIEDFRKYMQFPLLPHRKTVLDFIFLTQGSMKRSKGLNSYEFSAYTFFFLPAYQISTDAFMSEDIKGFYCHFDPDMLKTSLVQPDIPKEFPFLQFNSYPLVQISAEAVEPVLHILDRLEKEFKNKRTDKLDLVVLYLLTLFTELKRFVHPEETITENAALRISQLYKNALTQHIYAKQKVSDYADMLNITPNHLNKCVKAATGKSAHDLLDEMLLLEAKVLLKQSDLNISEIAYKVGKEDQSSFGKFFKLKTGFTPKQYRVLD